MASTDILQGMQGGGAMSPANLTGGQPGGANMQMRPDPLQLLVGFLSGALKLPGAQPPQGGIVGGQGGPRNIPQQQASQGGAPFTNSRVNPDGTLRPYNPTTDGPDPGTAGMMADGKGGMNPLMGQRSGMPQPPRTPQTFSPMPPPHAPGTMPAYPMPPPRPSDIGGTAPQPRSPVVPADEADHGPAVEARPKPTEVTPGAKKQEGQTAFEALTSGRSASVGGLGSYSFPQTPPAAAPSGAQGPGVGQGPGTFHNPLPSWMTGDMSMNRNPADQTAAMPALSPKTFSPGAAQPLLPGVEQPGVTPWNRQTAGSGMGEFRNMSGRAGDIAGMPAGVSAGSYGGQPYTKADPGGPQSATGFGKISGSPNPPGFRDNLGTGIGGSQGPSKNAVAAPGGTTGDLTSPEKMADYRERIAAIESSSSGGYNAVNSKTGAVGRYQVMPANVGPWTKEALGKAMTPEEFKNDHAAQDKVFDVKFGQSVKKYGNASDAASVWFTGRPAAQGANKSDGSTTGAQYVALFNKWPTGQKGKRGLMARGGDKGTTPSSGGGGGATSSSAPEHPGPRPKFSDFLAKHMGQITGGQQVGGQAAQQGGGGGKPTIDIKSMFSISSFEDRICRGGSGGGGGAGGGGSVPVYQYSGLPKADVNAQSAITNLYNNPQAQQIYNQAQGSMGGIPGQNTGYNPANVTQMGLNVQDAAAGLPFMAQQIYQTGFDPQQALFQQMQQQVTDQTNAQLSNPGLTNSPFAAGIMGQNLSGLDINWQNNLLNRELQAAQGAEGALGQYGNLSKTAAGLQFQGPESQMQVSDFLSGLNSQTLAQAQQAIGDWLNYLTGGTSAAGVAAQEQMKLNDQSLQAQQMNMQQQNAMMQMGMGLLQPLAGAMGK